MKYGLIGEKLGHSFSKEIHEAISDYTYELKEIDIAGLHQLMSSKNFTAINVTIPYKVQVIPYLDHISPEAKMIRAVNTIVNKNGVLYGYNTDYLGLRDLIITNQITIQDKKVVILGDGGTAKTANAVVKMMGAKSIHFVSLFPSDKACSYKEVPLLHADAQVIINATPCGMYPDNDGLILDITTFEKLEAVIDVIYNPLRTNIVKQALNRSIKGVGGLYMLVAQAVYASAIFQDKEVDHQVIDKIYQKLLKQKENIVLIGMPGSGKSTIGSKLSEMLGKTLVDSDIEIEKVLGKPISEFLTKDNEEEFRTIESEVIEKIAKMNNLIISTGGGVIKKDINIQRLKANGLVIFIDRKLELLEVSDSRPLSSNVDDLRKRYAERYDLYKKYADIVVENNDFLELVLNKIINEVL